MAVFSLSPFSFGFVLSHLFFAHHLSFFVYKSLMKKRYLVFVSVRCSASILFALVGGSSAIQVPWLSWRCFLTYFLNYYMNNFFKKNSTVVVLLLVLIVIVVAGFWFKKPMLTNTTTGTIAEVKKTKPNAPDANKVEASSKA